MKKRKKAQAGQAIIEFLIVMSIILTLIFVFVQLAWSIAWGHYAHYATFMASRAYLSAGITKQDQVDAASSVLNSMLKTGAGQDILPFVAKSRRGDERDITGEEPVTGAFIGTHPTAVGSENSRPFSWAEGVQYNFDVRVFILPLASFIANEGKGKTIEIGDADNPAKAVEYKGAIPFTSDSFLGRETTVSECVLEMNRISNSLGISRQDNADFLEDNGC